MLTLYHLWLDPFSRMVRVILAEKGLDFDMVVEKTWDRRPEFLALNPAGTVPVLVEDKKSYSHALVVAEYLNEKHPNPDLLGRTPEDRAETRRLCQWFNEKFYQEVTDNLLNEKVMKRFLGLGEPHSGAIRAGHYNMHSHLEYIGYLCERRNWLAGGDFSIADVAAAAQISSLDYLGDVDWTGHREAKNWYAKVKSRPSFRSILADHIPGMPPPRHYADLDF